MPLRLTSRRAIALAAALCVAGYVWVYGAGLASPVIRSDGFSYYIYVPSWFLYHDTTLVEVARDCCGGVYPEYTGIFRWPGTRRWINVHPMGVALMQAPVFPVAHALTRWTNLPADGFSLYYQHAAGLAGLAWIVAGLAVLRRLLHLYFSEAVVSVTLLTTLLGTNLMHYATYDSSYSHGYSFFLFAAFMYLSARWHSAPSTRLSVLLGTVAGLIALTRHSNVLFANVFWIYGALMHRSFRAEYDILRRQWKHVAVIVAVGVAVIAPQLAMYYAATGRVLVSPYAHMGSGFNWASPRLYDVLFGVTKGLFFWSPLLLLAVAGFIRLLRTKNPARNFIVPGVIFLGIHAYVIASWWDWQLGGSYGSRGFVDALPLFSLGLAAFFEWSSRSSTRRAITAVVVIAGVGLSLFQMLQYWYGIVPFKDMAWPMYREIFLQWR